MLTSVLLIAVCAFAFRIPHLDQRPMHTDEAVHAAKAEILIETGTYTYDPHDYHGPTIYYFALPFVWFSGARGLTDTTESTFRIVPVIFGVGLVLLLLLMRDGLGGWPVIAAGILTAISPAMVFYSRYYIQEMVFVFFTFGALACGWRYFQVRARVRAGRPDTLGLGFGWALLAGVCVGLMQASKETSILVYMAITGALAISAFQAWRQGQTPAIRVPHVIAGIVVALVVAMTVVSGFFTHPRGAIDLFATYLNYFHRADGAGAHDHPWFYYLQMLAYTKTAPGPWWSEGLILALGAIGFVAAVLGRPIAGVNRHLARFLAWYTAILIALYSAIPYKTPWCMLGFLHGMILLSGVGFVFLLRLLPNWPARVLLCIALGAAAYQLGQQAYRANYKFYADTRNPYVYGHTSTDMLRLDRRIEDIAAVAPEGRRMSIQVITPDAWPLPWYLREFKHVGYRQGPGGDMDAPVVITSQELEPEVAAGLRGTYHSEFYGLRPEVLIVVYIRQDLWDAFVSRRAAADVAPTTARMYRERV
jgi:uncharacterized protein (TIGR03663 family)